MSEAYLGEVRLFAGNFAPRAWAFCDGQLLPIAQNTALFSLLGTTYGGDGQTTFALPDLRGRVPIGRGTGQGLDPYSWGERGGTETVTLTASQVPSHTHNIRGSSATASATTPEGNVLAEGTRRTLRAPGSPSAMDAGAITSTGGSGSHTNLQPYLGLNYIIALQGYFPSEN